MSFRAHDTGTAPTYSDEDSFERGTALDDLELRIRSRAFRGGKLTAVMSDVTIDLREATLSPDGATISVQSAGSEIDILLPRDWHVVFDLDAVFGGVDWDRFPPTANEHAPCLRVTGMVVAGDLCVR